MRLIVSAWLPEQSYLREQGSLQRDCTFLLTGVGPLKACLQVARAIEKGRKEQRLVTRVSFVGTAGAYDTVRFPLLSAHRVAVAVFTDAAAASGLSYFPAEASPHGRTSVSPLSQAAEPGLVCVCPPSVTRDATFATSLARLGSFENLELAGIAEACAEDGVPWEAYLGVSNAVGPSSHEEWKASHAEASLAAQRLFMQS